MDSAADFVKDAGGWITDIGNQYSDVTEQIKENLKDPVHTICKAISKGTGFTYATQQGYADGFLESVDFHRDKAGIFHTSPDCWQQYMGYCDLYDWVFDVATDMKKNKYPVKVDGEQYCIWMWKGDYLNLGAGAETGIYKGGEPFWDVAVDDAMPMTLTTYDKDGNTIMCYIPDDPQWWITGFDSMTQYIDPDDLTVIGSIDMSSYPELWKAFKKKIVIKNLLIFFVLMKKIKQCIIIGEEDCFEKNKNSIILCMNLGGCVRPMSRRERLTKELGSEQQMADRMMEDIATALDARDADALKSLFSKTALEEATDIDQQISDLLQFYQGKKQSF